MNILYRTVCLSMFLVLALAGCDKQEDAALNTEATTAVPVAEEVEVEMPSEVSDVEIEQPPMPQQQPSVTAEDMAAEAAMGAHD